MRLHEVPRNWSWLGPLLAPAVARDDARTLDDVKAGLLDGSLGAVTVHFAEGAGVVVLSAINYADAKVLWLTYLAGRTTLKPKAWVRRMTEILRLFEDAARHGGCTEMRLQGRDWSFLPGYSRLERTTLRKVLT